MLLTAALTALLAAESTAPAADTARASLVLGLPLNRPRAMEPAVLASAPVYNTVADGRNGRALAGTSGTCETQEFVSFFKGRCTNRTGLGPAAGYAVQLGKTSAVK